MACPGHVFSDLLIMRIGSIYSSLVEKLLLYQFMCKQWHITAIFGANRTDHRLYWTFAARPFVQIKPFFFWALVCTVQFNNFLLFSISIMSERHAGEISVPRPLKDGKSMLGADTQDDSAPQRPSEYSRYIKMLLELDEIPWWHNLLASLCTWLLLAGYVVLPGAFTSIRNSQVLSDEAGVAGKAVVKAAQTLPVLLVAGICCLLGVAGMAWLWGEWSSNYVWLLNKIIV